MADTWGHCTHMCSHALYMNLSCANTVQPKTTTLGGFRMVPAGRGGSMGVGDCPQPSWRFQAFWFSLALRLWKAPPFQGVSWSFLHQCPFHWRFYCLKVPPSLVLKGYLTSPSQEGWETSETNNTFLLYKLCAPMGQNALGHELDVNDSTIKSCLKRNT